MRGFGDLAVGRLGRSGDRSRTHWETVAEQFQNAMFQNTNLELTPRARELFDTGRDFGGRGGWHWAMRSGLHPLDEGII